MVAGNQLGKIFEMNHIVSEEIHPSDRDRKGDWRAIYDGGDEDGIKVEVAPTSGYFRFSPTGSHAGSDFTGCDDDNYLEQVEADPGFGNEFGRWMDSHRLFRQSWTKTAKEIGYTEDEAELWYLKLTVAGNQGPIRYLIVPTKLVTITDHAGTAYDLEGFEAGLCLMAIAWNEAIWRFGSTGIKAMLTVTHPSHDARYQKKLDGEYRLAACCFENAAAVLD